jgi:hypothetical protein
MRKAANHYVVIDTVVHKSEEALISVRPIVKPGVTGEADISLEFVSSRKAIFWMSEEVGYKEARLLTDQYEKIGSMWDYIAGQRECLVLSNGAPIDSVWPNAVDQQYLPIKDDFKKYGYFPEMHAKGVRT